MPLNIVVGGLRTSNNQPMDAELKSTLQEHWHSVAAKTGLPISTSTLEREDFIYDTEPACRAVVAIRMLAPQAGLAAFNAIQRAFYAEGKDVTQGSVLAEVISAALSEAGVAVDATSFLAAWNSDAAKVATREDFLQVQRWKVPGFPTLVLERDGQLDLVTSGYTRMATLVERLEALVAGNTSAA